MDNRSKRNSYRKARTCGWAEHQEPGRILAGKEEVVRVEGNPGTCNQERVDPFPFLEEVPCGEDCLPTFSCACDGHVSWAVIAVLGDVLKDAPGRHPTRSVP